MNKGTESKDASFSSIEAGCGNNGIDAVAGMSAGVVDDRGYRNHDRSQLRVIYIASSLFLMTVRPLVSVLNSNGQFKYKASFLRRFVYYMRDLWINVGARICGRLPGGRRRQAIWKFD
jgi:hypothetical protein